MRVGCRSAKATRWRDACWLQSTKKWRKKTSLYLISFVSHVDTCRFYWFSWLIIIANYRTFSRGLPDSIRLFRAASAVTVTIWAAKAQRSFERKNTDASILRQLRLVKARQAVCVNGWMLCGSGQQWYGQSVQDNVAYNVLSLSVFLSADVMTFTTSMRRWWRVYDAPTKNDIVICDFVGCFAMAIVMFQMIYQRAIMTIMCCCCGVIAQILLLQSTSKDHTAKQWLW